MKRVRYTQINFKCTGEICSSLIEYFYVVDCNVRVFRCFYFKNELKAILVFFRSQTLFLFQPFRTVVAYFFENSFYRRFRFIVECFDLQSKISSELKKLWNSIFKISPWNSRSRSILSTYCNRMWYKGYVVTSPEVLVSVNVQAY